MDESSLEEAIKTYSAQLQQVEVALSAGLGSVEQADLLKLKEDLQQLTEPTESNLVSQKKPCCTCSSWGTLEYHNAMVVCPEGEEARVRVLYLHPTNKSMKPCGFYLEGKCRFMDNCRCCLLHLRGFFSGSACLAKHEDGIWYPARISGDLYTMKFDSLLLKEAVLEADGIIPPLRQDDGSSSSSSDSEDDTDQCDAREDRKLLGGERGAGSVNSAEFCGWEAHTRGIGSKLLLKMGYELGKGLGETLSGRVEPVQAVVFPKDRSLDMLKRGKPPHQHALGDRAQSASHSSSSSVIGVEAYRGGKSTKHSLTTEKVAQVEREIQQLTKSLSRRNGRYTLFILFAPGQFSSLFLIINIFLDISLTSVKT
uniref:Zinc finger CCCH-type with G patch domain-containing protein n=1 Tax=Sinocyclocheilus anshuiensis TaxID=1608454 RepID=A0A671NLL7_9TELE